MFITRSRMFRLQYFHSLPVEDSINKAEKAVKLKHNMALIYVPSFNLFIIGRSNRNLLYDMQHATFRRNYVNRFHCIVFTTPTA